MRGDQARQIFRADHPICGRVNQAGTRPQALRQAARKFPSTADVTSAPLGQL